MKKRGFSFFVILSMVAAQLFLYPSSTLLLNVSAATVTDPIATISLVTTSTTLKLGNAYHGAVPKQKLVVNITPTSAVNNPVVWTSDNPDVATVAADGTVTAVSPGNANITVASAADSSKKATCAVTVIQLVTGITLDPTAMTLTVGSSAVIAAVVSPPNAENKSVNWNNNYDKSVATVDSSGTVTAVAPGTVNLYVFSSDGSNIYVYCTVTVIPAPIIYTVTFDSQGGSAVDSATVNQGDIAVQPTDPTKTGYSFMGWYTDASLSALWDFSTPINSDVTLYAGWDNVLPPPTSITMSTAQTTLNMKVGTKLQLLIDVNPVGSDSRVTWTSSNPAVATVDPVTGLVTALKTGSVRVTVTSVADPTVSYIFLVIINA